MHKRFFAQLACLAVAAITTISVTTAEPLQSSGIWQAPKHNSRSSGGKMAGVGGHSDRYAVDMITPTISRMAPNCYRNAFFVPSGVPVISAGGDYAGDMIGGGASRWSTGRFPLHVFIGGNAQDAGIMVTALNEWQSVSGGLLSWAPTSDPGSADVVVTFQNGPSSAGREAGDTNTQTGMDANGQSVIQRAFVTILTCVDGRNVSDLELKKTCLHEMGHAFGLVHSSNPSDIMYWQSGPSQFAHLTARDGLTIRKIYSL